MCTSWVVLRHLFLVAPAPDRAKRFADLLNLSLDAQAALGSV
jgi:hypothetical protein